MEEIKNCEYCTPVKKDIYGNGTGEYIDGIDKNSGMCFFMTNGMYILRSHNSRGYNEIKPKYCPMCGKKLVDL